MQEGPYLSYSCSCCSHARSSQEPVDRRKKPVTKSNSKRTLQLCLFSDKPLRPPAPELCRGGTRSIRNPQATTLQSSDAQNPAVHYSVFVEEASNKYPSPSGIIVVAVARKEFNKISRHPSRLCRFRKKKEETKEQRSSGPSTAGGPTDEEMKIDAALKACKRKWLALTSKICKCKVMCTVLTL